MIDQFIEFLKEVVGRRVRGLLGRAGQEQAHIPCAGSMCWNGGAGEAGLIFPKPVGSRGGSGDLLEDREFELGLEGGV